MTLISNSNYTSIAFRIGTSLCKNALWNNNSCNWLEADFNYSRKEYFYHPMVYNFYEGNCGVAFFLTNLFGSTNETVFKTTAIAALNQSFFQSQNDNGIWSPSFYFGKSGLAYVMLHAAHKFNDNELYQKAETLTKQITEYDYTKAPLDLTHGAAGLIPFLIYASAFTKNKKLIDEAVKRADHLIANAITTNNTMCWNYLNEHNIPFIGFAHGASGMAYAFAMLYKVTGKQKYKQVCDNAFNYEDTFFNTNENNWRSLDEFNNSDWKKETHLMFQSKWCYGAAGMGLARIAAFQATGNINFKKMAQHACLAAINSKKDISNFSLCHGHFSNAEFLLTAARTFNDNVYMNQAIKLADYGIHFSDNNNRDWPSGLMGSVPLWSFMNGMAGIGNFYLRIENDAFIPSGLVLEELLK